MIFASLSMIMVAFATVCHANIGTFFVDDLLTHSTVNHTWMEIGYANLTDTEWTTITTSVNTLNPDNSREMSVFLSLPEYGGQTATSGFPLVVKMNGRATKTTGGTYEFQARLVQPNDSFCPKVYWTPEPAPMINVGWMVVEEGVYNITSSMLVFGSGNVTRDNSVPLLQDDEALYHAKYTLNYTTGCDENDPDAVCQFTEKVSDVSYSNKGWSHLGATNQIQTSINKVDGDKELFMNTRIRTVFPDRIVMMLAVHSVYVNNNTLSVLKGPYNFNFSIYPDYADIHTPELVSYFVWEKNIRLTCVEGLVMETSIQYPITDSPLQMDYFYEFDDVPGLFGMIGTLQSVADTVSLRVFNRTVTGSNFITQEDQCTDLEENHISKESAFSMVVGKAKDMVGDTNCFIAYDVRPCTYTIYLYDLFNDGWENVELVVDTGAEVLKFTTSCGNKAVTFTSISCTFNAYMQTTDGGKPITWWENYWRYEHNDGTSTPDVVYIGDYDSTITVIRETVTFTDLANTRVEAKENKCEACKVAPPPPKKGPGKGGDGNGNAANGGVADLTAGNIVPTPPVGVGVAPDDAGAPAGTLQITGVVGPLDAEAAPGAATFIVSYALNVVRLSSAVDSVAFYRGAAGIVGPSMHSIDVTGLTTDFFIEGSFEVSEADIVLWMNGEIYIRVNTADHLSGEIRAQAVLPSDWVAYYNGETAVTDDKQKVDGPSAGKEAGKAKTPPAPVPVLIELFEEFGDGWFNNSGSWSHPMTVQELKRRMLKPKKLGAPAQNWVLDTDVPVFPDILMYPTYVIMNVDKTKQLHVGSLCPKRGVERCEERLPPHGEFVYRVMGKDPEGDDSWKFCGVTGFIGQELQFEMKKGKCVPVSVTNSNTLCSFNTKVTLSGNILLAGVSAQFSEIDSKVLENEVASMLVATTHVSINSWSVNSDGNMEVSFQATILAEKQGVDGSIRENVDTLVSTLQSNIENAFSSGAFLSSMETALAEYPQDMMSIKKTTGATLTSLQIVSIEYVEASTAISERTPASLPAASQQAEAVVTQDEEGVSMIVTACAIVGVVVAVAAIAIRARQPVEYSHQELAVDSEHADSIPEFDLGLEHAAAPKGLFFTSKERF